MFFHRENAVAVPAISAVPRLVTTDECGPLVSVDDEHLFETNVITLKIEGIEFTPEQQAALSSALGAWKYGAGPVDADVFENISQAEQAQIEEVILVR